MKIKIAILLAALLILIPAADFARSTAFAASGESEKWVRTRREDFNADGTPAGSYTKYDYDEHGNVIREEQHITADGDPIVYEYAYTYDEKGNPVSKTQLSPSISITQYAYEYDGDRIVEETKTVRSDPRTKESVIRYFFDESGREIRRIEERYGGDGEPTSTIEITYERDDRGRMLSQSRYNVQKDVRYTATYSYDEHGKTTQRRLDNHGSYFFDDMDYENEYDAQGNLVRVLQTQYWKDEIYHLEYRYEYDAEGRRTKAYTRDYAYTFWSVDEYDAQGHIVKEYRVEDGDMDTISSFYVASTYMPLSEYLAGQGN